MPQRVLITGATGFAGSFLVQHYATCGWEVHGTFRDPADDRTWLPDGVVLHPVDLMVAEAVRQVVSQVQPDAIVHLAAQSSVSVSFEEPMRTLEVNATMQFHLLEAVAETCRDARVVVVGSADEYGQVALDENPVAETAELRPASPYALSKVTQDLMAIQYAERGIEVVRVRPFLQLGPRRPDRFVAGSFARQVAEIEQGIRPPIIMVGTLDLLRDFTDVRDVARAYALAAQHGVPGAVYNIASGAAHSLRNLLDLMLQRAGVSVEIRADLALQRGQEMPLLIGDATHLKEATGWEPEISFEQSAGDTLDYWRGRVPYRQGAQGI